MNTKLYVMIIRQLSSYDLFDGQNKRDKIK